MSAAGGQLGVRRPVRAKEPGRNPRGFWRSGWPAGVAVVVAFAVALAGCAGPAVEPEPRIVRVEVPVEVPCRTDPVAVPPWAAEGLRKTDSLEVKVRVLLAERRQAQGYMRELLAANEACR